VSANTPQRRMRRSTSAHPQQSEAPTPSVRTDVLVQDRSDHEHACFGGNHATPAHHLQRPPYLPSREAYETVLMAEVLEQVWSSDGTNQNADPVGLTIRYESEVQPWMNHCLSGRSRAVPMGVAIYY
jgi:hypothetical protein